MAGLSRSVLLKLAVFVVIGAALIVNFLQTPTLTNLQDGSGNKLSSEVPKTTTTPAPTDPPVFDAAQILKPGWRPHKFGTPSRYSPAQTAVPIEDLDSRVSYVDDTMGQEEFFMEPFGSYRQLRHTIGSGPPDKIMSLIMKEDGTPSDIRILGHCRQSYMAFTHYFKCDWVCTVEYDDPNTDCMQLLQAETTKGRGAMLVELPSAIGRNIDTGTTDYGQIEYMGKAFDQEVDEYLDWIPNKTVFTFIMSIVSDQWRELSATAPHRKDITSFRNASHPRHLKRSCDEPTTCEMNCDFDLCVKNPGYCQGDEDSSDVLPGDEPGDDLSERDLIRRARRAQWVQFTSGATMKIMTQDYPSQGSLLTGANGAQVLKSWFDYTAVNCNKVAVKEYKTAVPGTGYVTEHILELQTIKEFLEAAEDGILLSGAKIVTPTVDEAYFRANWNNAVLPANVDLLDTKRIRIPNDRVFVALGSRRSRSNFVLLADKINSVKARMWARNDLYVDFNLNVNKWLTKNGKAVEFLIFIKSTQAVFSYLQDTPAVKLRFEREIDEVRAQLDLIDRLTRKSDGTSPRLATIWDEFIPDFLGLVCDHSKDWVVEKIASARDSIANAKIVASKQGGRAVPSDLKEVEGILDLYEANLSKMTLSRRN